MVMRAICLALGVMSAALYGLPAAEAAPALIEGYWRTENGGQVQIRPCGATQCGYIAEVAVPRHIYNENKDLIDEVGMQNLPDVFNRDPALRNRRLLGLKIFTVTGREPDGRLRGELYNAEDGNTYEGVLTVHNSDKIELSGCVFFNLICRSEVWRRVR